MLFVSIKPLRADISRNDVRAINIGLQSVLTLVKGIIQKKVHSAWDVANCLLFGAAGGYLFYEAKEMAGRGDLTHAYLLANLGASMSENAAGGHLPFSYLGYTFGPFRFNLTTPLARKPKALINVDFMPHQALAYVYTLVHGNMPHFRNGLLCFTRSEPYEVYGGLCIGNFPVVPDGSPEEVWNHEILHTLQGIQTDSVEINVPLLEEEELNNVKFTFLRMNGVVAPGYYTLFWLLQRVQSYESFWMEKEAYLLTEMEDNGE
jgi:hypothetical protein